MSRRDGTFFGDPGQRGNGPPNIDGMVTLKIDNIAFNCTVEELRYAFEKYGKLGDVYIPRDMRTGDPRGFAFVRYLDQRDADDAIDRLDGERLGGRELRIQYAKRRRPEDAGGGRGGRGGGRGRFGGGGGYRDRGARGGGYGGGGYGRDDRGGRSRSPRRRSRSRSSPRRRGHRSPSVKSRSRSPPSKKDRQRHESRSASVDKREKTSSKRSRSESRGNERKGSSGSAKGKSGHKGRRDDREEETNGCGEENGYDEVERAPTHGTDRRGGGNRRGRSPSADNNAGNGRRARIDSEDRRSYD